MPIMAEGETKMMHLLQVNSCEECPFSGDISNDDDKFGFCSISLEVTEDLLTKELNQPIHELCPLRKCAIHVSINL